jgi:hypothetical protein
VVVTTGTANTVTDTNTDTVDQAQFVHGVANGIEGRLPGYHGRAFRVKGPLKGPHVKIGFVLAVEARTLHQWFHGS